MIVMKFCIFAILKSILRFTGTTLTTQLTTALQWSVKQPDIRHKTKQNVSLPPYLVFNG